MILADCASPTFRVYDPDELRPRRVTIARNAAGAAPDAVRGVRHDARGRRFAVWSAADGATQLDVLSEEGVYLARVRFPAPWLDFAFDGGTVFALEEGDPARLAAYSLRLPGDPSPRRTMGGAR
jgi:hypothetical protein